MGTKTAVVLDTCSLMASFNLGSTGRRQRRMAQWSRTIKSNARANFCQSFAQKQNTTINAEAKSRLQLNTSSV